MIDDLYQVCTEWELKRTERLQLEREFLRFTGRMDVVELHVPYTKYDYFFDVLRRAKQYNGHKIIVFAGDNLNLDVFGPFFRQMTSEKTDQARSLHELTTLLRLLKETEKIYDRIIFMQTNHDRRLYKVLYRTLTDKKQAEEMVGWIKPLKDFMEEAGLKKIVHVPGIMFKVGDAVISHWENNLSVPGSLPRKIVRGILARVAEPVSVIYQAHSHYQCRLAVYRKLFIETGALARIFDYARGDKLWGEEKTITIGYAHGELANGKAIWDKCNYTIFEIEGYM